LKRSDQIITTDVWKKTRKGNFVNSSDIRERVECPSSSLI